MASSKAKPISERISMFESPKNTSSSAQITPNKIQLTKTLSGKNFGALKSQFDLNKTASSEPLRRPSSAASTASESKTPTPPPPKAEPSRKLPATPTSSKGTPKGASSHLKATGAKKSPASPQKSTSPTPPQRTPSLKSQRSSTVKTPNTGSTPGTAGPQKAQANKTPISRTGSGKTPVTKKPSPTAAATGSQVKTRSPTAPLPAAAKQAASRPKLPVTKTLSSPLNPPAAKSANTVTITVNEEQDIVRSEQVIQVLKSKKEEVVVTSEKTISKTSIISRASPSPPPSSPPPPPPASSPPPIDEVPIVTVTVGDRKSSVASSVDSDVRKSSLASLPPTTVIDSNKENIQDTTNNKEVVDSTISKNMKNSDMISGSVSGGRYWTNQVALQNENSQKINEVWQPQYHYDGPENSNKGSGI